MLPVFKNLSDLINQEAVQESWMQLGHFWQRNPYSTLESGTKKTLIPDNTSFRAWTSPQRKAWFRIQYVLGVVFASIVKSC